MARSTILDKRGDIETLKLYNDYLKTNKPIVAYYEEISKNEVWEQVVIDETKTDFFVSSFGNIRYKSKDHNIYKARYGYDYVVIADQNFGIKTLRLDYLIAVSFIPKTEDLLLKLFSKMTDEFDLYIFEVLHKNGDKHDCFVSNLEWTLIEEEWKILTYPGVRKNRYMISSFGRVYNIHTNELMRTRIDKDGYEVINMAGADNGNKKLCKVHRMVCYSFISEDIMNLQVNHINGNKRMNIFTNLEPVTNSENIKHAYSTGLITPSDRHGERSNRALLTSIEAEYISKLLLKYDGNCFRVLNHLINNGFDKCSYAMLQSIKFKKSWVEESDKYFDKNSFKIANRSYLQNDEVHLICKELVNNNLNVRNTYNALKTFKNTNFNISNIDAIKHKKCHKKVSSLYF